AAAAGLVLTAAAAALFGFGVQASAAKPPDVLHVGVAAPAVTYTTLAGASRTLASSQDKATLLWFVTTSCPHCQQGTQAIASNIDALAAEGVRVVELESYHDLGSTGPSIAAFGRQYAGAAFTNPAWSWGQASQKTTRAYDPGGYDNVYYLVGADGRVTYVNASPAATMQTLMVAVTDLSRGFTGPIGPEGVPVPAAPALAGLKDAATGKPVDGISCSTNEQLLFHVHTHLTIFVDGKAADVPAGIGIAPPRSAQTSPYGSFVDSGTCFYWLHTHAKDGIIHIESPLKRSYTLGQFFDLWGEPLGPDRVGPVKGKVTAFVDGHRYQGNPRAIALGNDVQIQLDVGAPVVQARLIRFPKGL
ncbi:MAG: redoxin domain-containing protein, partial [Deinococcales bacterium]